jgi:hypothetical protein
LIDAKTTEERIVMRLLISGEDQLGGFTPRPQEPSDSLACVQINESLLNNGIQRLQLDGRTFMMPELAKHIAAVFGRLPQKPAPENEDVKITFAAKDAVSVRCQDGKLAVTLSIVKLSNSSHAWKNFQVTAYYTPKIEGRSARLSRDGYISLSSRRADLALRGVFSHVFSKETTWELVPEVVLNQPKLKNAVITQFVIDDGWIGIALGPKPVTAQRQPSTAR